MRVSCVVQVDEGREREREDLRAPNRDRSEVRYLSTARDTLLSAVNTAIRETYMEKEGR